MSADLDPRQAELPATLPIFPLTGVLLLPRGKLPLNIFEPRYLAMVRDALAGDRMIGMVQPREDDPSTLTGGARPDATPASIRWLRRAPAPSAGSRGGALPHPP
jgi:hypothetical protein